MVSSLTFHFLTMSVIQLDCCHLPQNCILKMLPLHGADSISEQFKLAAKNNQHLLIRNSAFHSHTRIHDEDGQPWEPWQRP